MSTRASTRAGTAAASRMASTRGGTASSSRPSTGDLERRVEDTPLHDFAIPPLQIGDEAPNFSCDSTVGLVTMHELVAGNWGLLLTFPRDFDPVGTTELAMVSKLSDEFEARNIVVLGISPDSKTQHRMWIQETQELQDCDITIPILADETGDVLLTYGLVRPDGVLAGPPGEGEDGAVEGEEEGNLQHIVDCSGVFLVDPDKRLRMIQLYPACAGRNFYEILRAIDAIQLSTFHQVSTPANWRQGEDVFIPVKITSTTANSMYPKGFLEIRNWFRLTPQPDLD